MSHRRELTDKSWELSSLIGIIHIRLVGDFS